VTLGKLAAAPDQIHEIVLPLKLTTGTFVVIYGDIVNPAMYHQKAPDEIAASV